MKKPGKINSFEDLKLEQLRLQQEADYARLKIAQQFNATISSGQEVLLEKMSLPLLFGKMAKTGLHQLLEAPTTMAESVDLMNGSPDAIASQAVFAWQNRHAEGLKKWLVWLPLAKQLYTRWQHRNVLD
ncbi:MAG: hypothetical protein C7N36_18650 [Bacteroidetes bacterium]|nr:MAG: hypothetical protein C7N36_18650 [Bacteroidota bacterium]